MKDKLPVLVSVPHGGIEIPKEVKGITKINKKDILEDSDAFTRDIYNVEDIVSGYVTTNVARAFVDINRSTDDQPPKNPDGVLKTITSFKKHIYVYYPDVELRHTLIEKYYTPYHKRIEKHIKSGNLKIGLDCHTMLPKAPLISQATELDNMERPAVCLCNNSGESCSFEILTLLSECFKETFQLKEHEIRFNDPVERGYVIQKYGNKPFPWSHIELNKNFYFNEPWFDENTLSIDEKRINTLNKNFRKTLAMFIEKLNDIQDL